MREVKDKNGKIIEEFDVLKVFHFIGPRRKKHYMYKWVRIKHAELYGIHLDSPEEGGYPLWPQSSNEMEIVQSRDCEKV